MPAAQANAERRETMMRDFQELGVTITGVSLFCMRTVSVFVLSIDKSVSGSGDSGVSPDLFSRSMFQVIHFFYNHPYILIHMTLPHCNLGIYAYCFF